jgi:hypothetical protein
VAELPPVEKRLADLLQRVAREVRPCKACGTQIALVMHANGKLTPYTIDGVNHFINCPLADAFRRGKKRGSDARQG